MEGNIHRKGGLLGWSKRYMKLENTILYIADTEKNIKKLTTGSTIPNNNDKNCIDMHTCQSITINIKDNREFTITCLVNNSTRAYEFRCVSSTECSQWKNVLYVFDKCVEFKSRFNHYSIPIPTIYYKSLLQCIDYLIQHGSRVEGILRISGSSTQVKQLYTSMIQSDQSTQTQSSVNMAAYDIHVVSSCFKQLLRDLPESLLGDSGIDSFIDASTSNDQATIRRLHQSLHTYNQHILAKITDMIVQFSIYNLIHTKMSITNINVCLSPNLTARTLDSKHTSMVDMSSLFNTYVQYRDFILNNGPLQQQQYHNTARTSRDNSVVRDNSVLRGNSQNRPATPTSVVRNSKTMTRENSLTRPPAITTANTRVVQQPITSAYTGTAIDDMSYSAVSAQTHKPALPNSRFNTVQQQQINNTFQTGDVSLMTGDFTEQSILDELTVDASLHDNSNNNKHTAQPMSAPIKQLIIQQPNNIQSHATAAHQLPESPQSPDIQPNVEFGALDLSDDDESVSKSRTVRKPILLRVPSNNNKQTNIVPNNKSNAAASSNTTNANSLVTVPTDFSADAPLNHNNSLSNSAMNDLLGIDDTSAQSPINKLNKKSMQSHEDAPTATLGTTSALLFTPPLAAAVAQPTESLIGKPNVELVQSPSLAVSQNLLSANDNTLTLTNPDTSQHTNNDWTLDQTSNDICVPIQAHQLPTNHTHSKPTATNIPDKEHNPLISNDMSFGDLTSDTSLLLNDTDIPHDNIINTNTLLQPIVNTAHLTMLSTKPAVTTNPSNNVPALVIVPELKPLVNDHHLTDLQLSNTGATSDTSLLLDMSINDKPASTKRPLVRAPVIENVVPVLTSNVIILPSQSHSSPASQAIMSLQSQSTQPLLLPTTAEHNPHSLTAQPSFTLTSHQPHTPAQSDLITSLQHQVAQLSTQLQLSSDENIRLNTQVNSNSSTSDSQRIALRELLNKYEIAVQSHTQQQLQIQSTVAELQKRFDDTNDMLMRKQCDIETLQQQLVVANKQISILQADNLSLRNKQIAPTYTGSDNNHTQLMNTNNQLNQHIVQLNNTIQLNTVRENELLRELQELEYNHGMTQAKLNRLQVQYNQQAENITYLATTIDTKQAGHTHTVQTMQHQINELNAQILLLTKNQTNATQSNVDHTDNHTTVNNTTQFKSFEQLPVSHTTQLSYPPRITHPPSNQYTFTPTVDLLTNLHMSQFKPQSSHSLLPLIADQSHHNQYNSLLQLFDESRVKLSYVESFVNNQLALSHKQLLMYNQSATQTA